MLSAEQNHLITRTGRGTGTGNLLRRYWQPVALVDELSGNRPIKPVKLLGENLVIFKDGEGRYGLLDRACPHRGTDLAFGRLEADGLRCAFHGWKFDVGGKCLETPAEPDGSNLCANIRQKSYPVVEKSGILFAYMGPGEPPALPDTDCFIAPSTHTFAFKGLIECNWLQSLEVGIDPAHTSFLHRFFEDEDPNSGYGKLFRDHSVDSDMPMTQVMREFPRPRIEVEQTDFGLRLMTLRQINDARMHVRVTNLIFPNSFTIPMSSDMTITQWHVPVDDTKHYWYAIFTSFGGPVDKDEMRRQRLELYELPDYIPRKNKRNDYGFDPHEQEHETYTGMGADINVHDQWACESMGEVQDRTREHLGQSDKAITIYRRILRDAIAKAAKDDEKLLMVLDPAQAGKITGPAAIDGIGPANDWQGYWRSAEEKRRKNSWAGHYAWPRRSAPMSSHDHRSSMSFVERHNLWSDEQIRAAETIEKDIAAHNLDLVRFSFPDQHGVLRGKTVIASEAVKLMRNGVAMTSTLLAKDTSHRTVFPVFTPGGGFGMPEMEGAGDFLMIADPTTFRVLPWAPNTGWVLCDIYFASGKPVPFSTRQLYRNALSRLAEAGYDFVAGLEVEFHLFKLENPKLAPENCTWPGEPPEVSFIHQGFQLLTEARSDQIEPILEPFWKTVAALGLPFRSLEVELGPSQCEFTFRPMPGLQAADMMILFRSAMKQIARRQGLHCTFMCRPGLPNIFSSGWHLHQSLLDSKTKANAFVSHDDAQVLSPFGRSYLAGLLTNAKAAAAFTTPTLNGYKRYRAYALAPDRVIWGQDNRGVMVRVLGQPGDPATHLENRVGEPAANPYLYMASQIVAGLDGVARKLDPGPSADTPYETDAEPMPKSLGEALDALRTSDCFRKGFGDGFVDYYLRIKDAEIARFRTEEKTDTPEITHWEQKEYFDLF